MQQLGRRCRGVEKGDETVWISYTNFLLTDQHTFVFQISIRRQVAQSMSIRPTISRLGLKIDFGFWIFFRKWAEDLKKKQENKKAASIRWNLFASDKFSNCLFVMLCSQAMILCKDNNDEILLG